MLGYKRISVLVLAVLFNLILAMPSMAWTGKAYAVKAADVARDPAYQKTIPGMVTKIIEVPNYLRYEDVHYAKTKEWAKQQMGFYKTNSKALQDVIEQQAEIIAESCDDVDSGETFKQKEWHLGTGFTPDALDWNSIKSLASLDSRIQRASEYLTHAKREIAKVSGLGVEDAETHRTLALTYLGNGLHALQDYFAHMNAGKLGYTSGMPWDVFYHDEHGQIAMIKTQNGKTEKVKLDYLFDSVTADMNFVGVTGDDIGRTKNWFYSSAANNNRLLNTEKATKAYIYEFLSAGYYEKSSGIRGRVTNSVSHNPIPGATVKVSNKWDKSVAVTVTTDLNGNYQTPQTLPPGEYKISVYLFPNDTRTPQIFEGPTEVNVVLPGMTNITRDIEILRKDLVQLVPSTSLITLDATKSIKFIEAVRFIGIYRKGPSEDLTWAVGISKPDASIATIEGGNINGISKGTTSFVAGIRANPWDPSTYIESTPVTIRVLPRELLRLETNKSLIRLKGIEEKKRFKEDLGIRITAIYKNGDVEDVTNRVHKFIVGNPEEPDHSKYIATIDEINGVPWVTGVNPGTATLRCTLWDGGEDEFEYRTVDIQVKVLELLRLESEVSRINLNVGDSKKVIDDLGIQITGIFENGETLDLTNYTYFFIPGSNPEVDPLRDIASVQKIENVWYIKGLNPGTTTLRGTKWYGAQGQFRTIDFTVNVIGQESGHLNGLIKDAVNNTPISEVIVSVKNSDGAEVGSGRSDSSGQFNISVPVGGEYQVVISKDGYIPVNYNNVTINADQTTYLEPVLQISEQHSGLGKVEGYVLSALDGRGVSGVTINFRKGINAYNGDIVATVITNSTGYYNVPELEAGNYTGEATKEGYTSTYFTALCVGGTIKTGQNGTITPILPEGQTRIVLTWGATPSDLDSHLTGPALDGSRFHVYYSKRSYSVGGFVYADLDLDDTSSYGPETTTIYKQTDGTYRFSVHDFSNRYSTTSTSLSQSGAQVKVYRGSTLLATYNIPNNIVGTVWTVFEMNGDSITPINTISSDSSPSNIQSISSNSLRSSFVENTDDLLSSLPPKS